MGIFLSPGVYDREVDFSTNVIGAGTTAVGMIGVFEKGPVLERTLVTSGTDLIRKFGIPHSDSYAGLAALQYLTYGRQLWVVRIAKNDIVTASVEINDDTPILGLTVSASSPGTWANGNVKIRFSDAAFQKAYAVLNEGVQNGVVTVYVNEPGVAGNAYTVEVVVDTTQEHALDATLVGSALTVTLATITDGVGGWQLNPAANTAALVATEITTVTEFTALYSGNGSASLDTAEEVNFSGGEVTTYRVRVEADGNLVEDHSGVHLDGSNTDGKYLVDVFANSKWISVEDEKDDWEGTFVPNGIHTLDGGTNGTVGLADSDKVTGLQLFSNPEDIDINLLVAPGYSTDAVVTEMISLCEARGDCMAIIDPPLGLSEQEVVDWHNGGGDGSQALNSSYAALYWDWLEVHDAYSGANRFVPPSGLVTGAYAYNDRVGEPWFAPAGFIRGRLYRAIKTSPGSNPSLGSRDFMYSGGNAVNPIVNFPQDGITIWGQRTLQRKPSATDRVNVRRLLLFIRKAVVRSTRYFIFEPNDEGTWLQWKNMVIPFLDNIVARRGLYDFRVVMDHTTVTAEDIDNNRMPGKILLKPTKSAEFIPIDFILYKTGASFSD